MTFYYRRLLLGIISLASVCMCILLSYNSHLGSHKDVELSERRAEKLYYTDRGMTEDEIAAVHKSKVRY